MSRLEDGPKFSLADWHICFCSASSSLFCGCGGREEAFRDRAEVKTVNGEIVLRAVIQGKALSAAPVPFAKERSPQYNTNLGLIAHLINIMSGVLVHVNKIAHSFRCLQTLMKKTTRSMQLKEIF